MAGSKSYKAQEIMLELADILAQRSPLKQVAGVDTDGYPTLLLLPQADSSETAGHKNVFIKVLAQPWPLPIDAVGLAQNVYTPTLIQLATEASAAPGVGTIFGYADLMPIVGEILSRGTRVEFYQSANGVAPVIGTIAASNLKYTWDPNFYRPLVNQQ